MIERPGVSKSVLLQSSVGCVSWCSCKEVLLLLMVSVACVIYTHRKSESLKRVGMGHARFLYVIDTVEQQRHEVSLR